MFVIKVQSHDKKSDKKPSVTRTVLMGKRYNVLYFDTHCELEVVGQDDVISTFKISKDGWKVVYIENINGKTIDTLRYAKPIPTARLKKD